MELDEETGKAEDEALLDSDATSVDATANDTDVALIVGAHATTDRLGNECTT